MDALSELTSKILGPGNLNLPPESNPNSPETPDTVGGNTPIVEYTTGYMEGKKAAMSVSSTKTPHDPKSSGGSEHLNVFYDQTVFNNQLSEQIQLQVQQQFDKIYKKLYDKLHDDSYQKIYNDLYEAV